VRRAACAGQLMRPWGQHSSCMRRSQRRCRPCSNPGLRTVCLVLEAAVAVCVIWLCSTRMTAAASTSIQAAASLGLLWLRLLLRRNLAWSQRVQALTVL
jgi:hypothetical protein